MKYTINSVAQKIKRNVFCQSSKKMVFQINNYIDEQINEHYESMKTGIPGQDRKTRLKLCFFSSIVFIGSMALLIVMPIGSLVSVAKDQIIEWTIKSPDELLLNLSNDYIENYPEIQVVFDEYTRMENATVQQESVEAEKDNTKNENIIE